MSMKIITALLMFVTAAISARSEELLSSNAVEMTALRKAVDDAYASYYHSTNDESDKLYNAWRQSETKNLPQILLLAQKEPESQTACEVFSWIAMKAAANRGPLFTNRLQSLDFLTKYHSTNTMLGPLCSYLGHDWAGRWREKSVLDFLMAVAEKNPDRAIRGQAIYGLGRIYDIKSEVLAEFENWGKSSFFTNEWTASDIAADARSGSSESAAAESERAFKDVIKNYADCVDLRERLNSKEEAPKLKKLAEENLFDLLHLSLGETAPEIETEAVDGKKFKLSDSRGKICVLTFWASWCGPCMQLVPVERALAERMHGKSFTMIGVNGDAILPDAKRAMEREQMTWPSFWNGKEGPKGPIATAWNVHEWPTVFFLDAKGIIRFKYEGYESDSSNVLNGCVNELMEKLQDEKP